MAAATTAASPAEESIRTRVPQAHFDAFVANCRAGDVPHATCNCMALGLIRSGQDGEIVLDAMGLAATGTAEGRDRQKAVTALLDRYGIPASRLQTLIAEFEQKGVEQLAEDCI
ncbi:hypothetical protein V5740_05815 [Croceibacterium sp. TMG7-5b_MA50]|uniref:hypothetical protein n=1 Tax=Croceibacterium sp. TMG7-5b_MA50 TaxID=3121290 RepID=UPI0032216669